ncbi:hypothetical protein [Bradyrhizobium sp. WSM1743]|uniref:hypothetical protein n=1 Tax=Bradyrhizobium sp. WSM1743 TaxID=318996 RepID=UPI00041BF164|nr:hypothetical protein [Bradyrhizobium sp. WSM1743]
MSIDSKRLKVSAIALVTGNSIVDDLWEQYFPELNDYAEVCRDIVINAHVQAILRKRLAMQEFVAFIEDQTDSSPTKINTWISKLCKPDSARSLPVLRKEIDEEDARLQYLQPTLATKQKLIEMGSDYAKKMHNPISSLLDKEKGSRVELVDDIQILMNADVHDY